MTFGSVAGSLPPFAGVFRDALDALAHDDVRVLMTVGRRVDIGALGALPGNAHVVAWLPQDDVAGPRVGGAGPRGLRQRPSAPSLAASRRSSRRCSPPTRSSTGATSLRWELVASWSPGPTWSSVQSSSCVPCWPTRRTSRGHTSAPTRSQTCHRCPSRWPSSRSWPDLQWTGERVLPDPAGPRVGDRRRPGDADAVRRPPGHLRRLHRVRPGAVVHRGLHPRRGAAALRQHPHRVQRHRPADHPAARGRAPDHPRGGRRRRRDRGDLRRVGHDGRDRQADRHASGCASPPPSTTATTCPRTIPPSRAAGRVHRPVRAPLQRAAVARVDRRRRRRSRRTPTATSTSTRSRAALRGATPTGR